MKGSYEPDTFTEQDVLSTLQAHGLKHKIGHRYITTQCPLHEDKSPSAQIFKNDWFVQCHSGCGRFHITKAFPELRQSQGFRGASGVQAGKPRRVHAEKEVSYKVYDLYHEWENMPLIPRDHEFKTIPLDILDDLGWRWDEYKNSYFIPYFNMDKTQIPFAQWRHLTGERRFTFLPGARLIAYGLWNLDNPKLFIVEGTSDCAVMEYAGVPWIGMPSASCGELVKALAGFCKKDGVQLIFAGDNDSAGLQLLEALDEVSSYRVRQPRKPYKDWGDMLEAEGIDSVSSYCLDEIFPQEYPSAPEEVSSVQKMALEMGAIQLNIVDPAASNKEQATGSTVLY